MIYIRSQKHFWNNPHVNLHNNTQSKDQQTCTNGFYDYPDRAPSALIVTGLVGLVLLSSLMRGPMTERIKRRIISSTALRKRADHYKISLMCLTLCVFSPLCTIFHCSAREECNQDIARHTWQHFCQWWRLAPPAYVWIARCGPVQSKVHYSLLLS